MQTQRKQKPAWGSMVDHRRALLDRRSGEDRRRAYHLDYFINGGIERRSGTDRRWQGERRADWRRVGKWYSVYCGDDRR